MKKAISWYALYQRLGKQPMKKTRNTYVQVMIDGVLRDCKLVYANHGSDFYLEPIEKEKGT